MAAKEGLDGEPTPLMATALGKHHLTVRQAWEISVNDPDIIALDPDRPPLIPTGQADAPAIRALKRLRAWQVKRG